MWFSNNIYIINNNIKFCSITLIYYINYLKYTNNIPVQFYRYLLFNMKPDTISIIIASITEFPL